MKDEARWEEHVAPERTDEQIRFAIGHKRLVQISYSGRVRVAEPHDYGVKNGTEKLLVYQLRVLAAANPKDFRVWRLLDLSKIEGCTVLDDTFKGSRRDSYRDHQNWDIVYARVA
jgi:hypothetical protein